MRATALNALAFHAGYAAVLAHADLEPDIGFRPAAMGDEGLLAVDHKPHAAAGLARQQRGDQFHIQSFGAAAEAAADMRLDHPDSRHVHAENLRQHQVHVIGHLGRSMHGHAITHCVVVGDRRVHLHLVLADLGAIVDAFADKVGCIERSVDIAELEQHVALEIMRALLMQRDRIGRHGLARRVIGGKFAYGKFDPAQRFFGHGIVDSGNGGNRLAAIAHAIARQDVLGAGDR